MIIMKKLFFLLVLPFASVSLMHGAASSESEGAERARYILSDVRAEQKKNFDLSQASWTYRPLWVVNTTEKPWYVRIRTGGDVSLEDSVNKLLKQLSDAAPDKQAEIYNTLIKPQLVPEGVFAKLKKTYPISLVKVTSRMYNDEFIEMAPHSEFEVTIPLNVPFRIRVWPTSYKPKKDMDLSLNPIATSLENSQYSAAGVSVGKLATANAVKSILLTSKAKEFALPKGAGSQEHTPFNSGGPYVVLTTAEPSQIVPKQQTVYTAFSEAYGN